MDTILVIANTYKVKLLDNIFFYRLIIKQDITREEYLECQKPFILAVKSWVDLLQELIDQLQNDRHKRIVMENVNDELGSNDTSGTSTKKSHVLTFHHYLQSLGCQNNLETLLEKSNEFTDKFKNSLLEIKDDWVKYAAALGIIEYVYVDISKFINKTLERNGWCDFPQYHYSTHEEVDIKHSMDLFSIVVDKDLSVIKDGFDKGFEIFMQMYTDLALPHCKSEIYQSHT